MMFKLGAFLRSTIDNLLSPDEKSMSSMRFSFLLSVIISNLTIFGLWFVLSIIKGELLVIPESVFILYGSANGLSISGKIIQKKL